MTIRLNTMGANELDFPVGVSSLSTANGVTTVNLIVVSLETNGSANSSQVLLNLEAGSNITLTDAGGGTIQIAATQGPFASTTGAPSTTPAAGTPAFDHAANTLWIYNGTAWKSVLLT